MFKVERFDDEGSSRDNHANGGSPGGSLNGNGSMPLTNTLARLQSLKQRKRKEREDEQRQDGSESHPSGFSEHSEKRFKDHQSGGAAYLHRSTLHDPDGRPGPSQAPWENGNRGSSAKPKRTSWREIKAQGRKKSQWVLELEREHGEVEGGEHDEQEGEESGQRKPFQHAGSFEKKKKRGGKKNRERKLKWQAEQGIKVESRGGESEDVEEEGDKMDVEEVTQHASSTNRDATGEESEGIDRRRSVSPVKKIPGVGKSAEAEKIEDEEEDTERNESSTRAVLNPIKKRSLGKASNDEDEEEASDHEEDDEAGLHVSSNAPIEDEDDEEAWDAEEDPHAERAESTPATEAALPPVRPHALSSLPDWLANPVTIPATLKKASEESSISNPQFGLSQRTISRLSTMGISHIFPVQQSILPRLLKSRYGTAKRRDTGDHLVLGDLCVSAPTGSGKTLAFALPILESLGSRVVTRLRALIVLPTRDLAMQVKATFDAVGKGSGLKIALVTGATSFAAEQAMLVDNGFAGKNSRSKVAMAVETEGRGKGSGKVDILVATPGRLTDHLRGTPGFTLRHLRFLVLDEADRLLSQSYQGWLDLVLKAASGADVFDPTVAAGKSLSAMPSLQIDVAADIQEGDPKAAFSSLWDPAEGWMLDEFGRPTHNVSTLRAQDLNVGLAGEEGSFTGNNVPAILRHVTPFQKLLFSATLTRNPAKIASLRLNHPTYIAVSAPVSEAQEGKDMDEGEDKEDGDERYTAPETLKEHIMVVTDPYDKPLALFYLLFSLGFTKKSDGGVLVFTKSVEAAHRLAYLIHFFVDHAASASPKSSKSPEKALVTAKAISSELSASGRRQLLDEFKKGNIKVLVCSDVMSRGMDLGANVKAVINYDAPMRAKTYVHRVGRTARAGRNGDAFTILETKEARRFKEQMAKVARPRVGRDVVVDDNEDEEERRRRNKGMVGIAKVRPQAKDIDPLREGYEHALEKLRDWVRPNSAHQDQDGDQPEAILGGGGAEEEEEEEEQEKSTSKSSRDIGLMDHDGDHAPSDDDDDVEDESDHEEDAFLSKAVNSPQKPQSKSNGSTFTKWSKDVAFKVSPELSELAKLFLK
ncbi:ATP-dependent RNA helicase dbp6 [Phlyctochytrium planicorne]|nr:ATP-dependent RNA helicase dbp6 [Phlyctochytrium planicorne]